jgi:hypothetical protein
MDPRLAEWLAKLTFPHIGPTGLGASRAVFSCGMFVPENVVVGAVGAYHYDQYDQQSFQ